MTSRKPSPTNNDIASRFSVRGASALITGASSGLGEHFAELLARSGATVVAAARRRERLDALASRMRDEGASLHPVAMDVADADDVARGVAEAKRLLGGDAPTILINNAGVASTALVEDASEADWKRALDVNLSGAWRVSKALLPDMKARGDGRIVNIASIVGFAAFDGLAAYAASKAGLIQLTRIAALEAGPFGVRVNAIAPGYIETDLNRRFLRSEAGREMTQRIPLRRIGAPSDLDAPLLMLCGNGGAWINGEVIVVDGGHALSP